jgi:ech hydrogenase subunit C
MPTYDAERFGVQITGDPKHADIFVITGSVNERNRDVIKTLYDQMPDPKVVVAAGICATSGGIFRECYHVAGGVDQVLPVDVYVTGCAVKPESILDGVLEAAGILEEKHKAFKKLLGRIEETK